MFSRTAVYLLLIVLAFFDLNGQVQVDPLTGGVNLTIPITNINSREISFPINAHYRNNGVKVDAPTGNLGTSWYLAIESSISRSVRDLPDDYYSTGAVKKYGWLHEGTAQMVQDYTPGLDLDSCSYDSTEYLNVAQFGGYEGNDTIRDIKPDLFSINVAGHLSASFVFGADGLPIQIGGEGLIIEAVMDTSSNNIAAFDVTAPNGFKYHFESMLFESSERNLLGTVDSEALHRGVMCGIGRPAVQGPLLLTARILI